MASKNNCYITFFAISAPLRENKFYSLLTRIPARARKPNR